jgi:uncharacterized protein YybS (DUF2232 family)
MQTRSRRWSDLTSGLGFALIVFAGYLLSYGRNLDWLAWPTLVVGSLLMFTGFWFYIRAKGYSPAWAFLCFLVGPLLFFVFFFLPDRNRTKAAAI